MSDEYGAACKALYWVFYGAGSVTAADGDVVFGVCVYSGVFVGVVGVCGDAHEVDCY